MQAICPCPDVHVPVDGVADSSVVPAGRRLEAETPVATAGPLLVVVTR